MSEDLQPLEGDPPITFYTLLKIANSHDAATVATAIEEHGIYTRDDFSRISKAEDDTGEGWIFRFNMIEMWHLEHHEYHMSGNTQTVPRNTQSRAMALLAMYHRADGASKGDFGDLEVYNLFSEMNFFGWPVEDTPDFDAIAAGVVTVTVEEPVRRQRWDGERSTKQLLGILSLMLANRNPEQFKHGEKPNATSIEKAAKKIAKKMMKGDVKPGNWRNIITSAIRELDW